MPPIQWRPGPLKDHQAVCIFPSSGASVSGVSEQVVHGFCAGREDGAQFLPVHHFRGAGAGVADQAGDLLSADALMAHQ